MTKLIQKTLSIPCNPKFLGEVSELLEESLGEARVPKRDVMLITLAIEEVITSITQYAEEKSIVNDVSVSIDIDDVRFRAVIVDSCNVFELNGGGVLSDSQFTERVDRERKYKLNMYLLRLAMDEITYSYKKGFENELVLIKFLQ